MGIDIRYGDGETPIDADELDALKPFWVATHEDLNRVEQENITKALLSLQGKIIPHEKLLTIDFVKGLHRKMFGEVWTWAGIFRQTNKTIGVEKEQISERLYVLLEDVRYWIVHKVYERDELALRAKHRIVLIHCFVNGNGRHARFFGDLLAVSLGRDAFSWGVSLTNARKEYLTALRLADKGDYNPLIAVC